MEWTKKTPDKPGYYWVRGDWGLGIESEILMITDDMDIVRLESEEYWSWHLYTEEKYKVEWYGPLEMPE